jgi:hypothetical protein
MVTSHGPRRFYCLNEEPATRLPPTVPKAWASPRRLPRPVRRIRERKDYLRRRAASLDEYFERD